MKKSNFEFLKKIIFLFAFCFFFNGFIFSQNNKVSDNENENSSQTESASEKQNENSASNEQNSKNADENNSDQEKDNSKTKKIYLSIDDFDTENVEITENENIQKNYDFFFSIGPLLYLTDNSKNSSSPVAYSVGGGMDFFKNKIVNLQTKISFFTNYMLWDEDFFRPAEIENSTCIVFSSFLDFKACHTFKIKKCDLEIGAGLSFLARIAISVGESENASYDKEKMNDAFYSNLNFLYPDFSIAFFPVKGKKWKGGIESSFYIPLGSILNGHSFDGAMILIGLKFSSI